MAAAAILFLKGPSEKVIRSWEIPREQLYQIWMQSNQLFISYLPTSFLGGDLGKWRLWLGAPPPRPQKNTLDE